MNLTHFECLNIPQRFDVDEGQLEQEYLAQSRAIHPDFHQLAGAAEQSASLELSASLNEAYTTLKDPFKRAEYLLQLVGAPSAGELRDMPGEFLEEMLDLRMEIASLKQDTPAVEKMRNQLTHRRDELLSQVGQLVDGHSQENRTKNLPAARRLQNAAKYICNLLRDLRPL